MAQRLALGREHQALEDHQLQAHALVELLAQRIGHRLHTLQRRGEVARHRAHGVAGKLQVGVGVGVRDLHVTHQRQRAHRGDLGRKGQGAGHQVAVDQFVEQLLAGRRGQQFALDRLAADDHVERRFHAQHARQALRAAGAGDQADLDFGQRDQRTRRHHAVVAAQRQLQPAAHAHGVHRGHHRLAAGLEGRNHRQQVGLGGGGGFVELGDVGTAREGLARAGDDDGRHRGIRLGLLQAIGNALAGGVTQAVDGGVVERDDGNVAADVVMGCHGKSFRLGTGCKRVARVRETRH